ncbi:hypothetical protein CDO73_11430 [Saccharibacillus sp. O23]|uniref:DUF421 domain-containing protein n=1 Tax=Saccharibacillus sp. O23 TaxID=2009338 RepID=UPI000B4DF4CD|nr:YetF domain-containing protein [Saccharibacillus sp. O23]OWR30516.1 hypothetical protein CDO73_11430 [Saccharibacillus sp. O23]
MLMFTLILKLMIGLAALIIVVRLLGKKELSQATPFDLVYLLVLGGILEESLYDDKVGVGHLLAGIVLWSVMVFGIEIFVRKKEKARLAIKGRSAMLIADGKLNVDAFLKNKMELEQFRSLLRQQGIFSLTDVSYAILETAGSISLIPQEGDSVKKPSYLLVNTGEIVEADIDRETDENWVREQLRQQGFHNVRRIFCAEWSEERGLLVVEYPDGEK